MAVRWVACSVVLAACSSSVPTSSPARPTSSVSARPVVHVALKEHRGTAPLVAFQDGDAAWVAVSCDDGCDVFPTGQRFGVASACATGFPFVTLTYATVGETPGLTLERCDTSGPFVHLRGQISGAAGRPVLSTSPVETAIPTDGRFDVELGPGVYDVIVADRVRDAEGSHVARFVILRDLDLRADREIEVDLARDGIETTRRRGRVLNAPSEGVRIGSSLQTRRGTQMHLSALRGSTADVYWVPRDAVADTDRLTLAAIATLAEPRGADLNAVSTGEDLHLGNSVGPVDVNVADAARVRLRASWSRVEGARWYQWYLSQQQSKSTGVAWFVNASSAWLGDGDAMALQLPEIDIAGWPDAVELWPGLPVYWTLSAATWVQAAAPTWSTEFEGRGASRRGTITP
jgi:hypothetical protein